MAAAKITRSPDGTYVREADSKPNDDGRNWITAEKGAAHSALWSNVKSLQAKQNYRRQADDLAMHLYSDMRYVGYHANASAVDLEDVVGARLGNNVIRSICRALNAKVARRRSRPYLVTNGARWDQRMVAENLERWLVGKLRQQKADAEVFPMFRLHAFTFGTGCIRVYDGGERGACLEVIPAFEILFDDSEARYGTPSTIYFVRTVSKAKLCYDYPDKKEIINQLGNNLGNEEWGNQLGAWDRGNTSDLALVIEAIHLPSGLGAGDGRQVIAIQSGTLVDEPWETDHFFCAWLRRELRPAGFWGIGVPEDLASTQIEITQTQEAISEQIDMFARPYWAVERGMKVQRAAISNMTGRVLEYTSTGSGGAPHLIQHAAVSPDLWRNREELKKAAFETEGVSQFAAQMLKPQGLNSGKALRAFHEMEAELLSDLMNGFDESLLRVCELLIEMQVLIASDPDAPDETVTFVGESEIEQIKWTDVGLKKDLDNYVIEILPASSLASTLSGRIEDVMDLRDLGAITDPNEIWEFIDMPDRRRQRRKHLSGDKLLEKVIEFQIVRKGQHVQPEPSWNLARAKEKALDAIQELELYEDAPVDRLALLREFIVNCTLVEEYGTIPTAGGLAGMENADALGSNGSLGGNLSTPGLDAGGLPLDLSAGGSGPLAGVGDGAGAGGLGGPGPGAVPVLGPPGGGPPTPATPLG